MLLHNFILDNVREDANCYQDFSIPNNALQQDLTHATGETPHPLASNNDKPKLGGHLLEDEMEKMRIGSKIWHRLAVKLVTHKLTCPLHHDMHCDSFGHVQMTS
jgi:hypothetical protein